MKINEYRMPHNKTISKPSQAIQISLKSNKIVEADIPVKRKGTVYKDQIVNKIDKGTELNHSISDNASHDIAAYDSNRNGYNDAAKSMPNPREMSSNYDGAQSNHSRHTVNVVKDFKGLNLDFVIKNLNNDRRVRQFVQSDTFIYVYFWCLAGSVSFYKQYFCHFDMNFYDLKCSSKKKQNRDGLEGWTARDLNTIYYESLVYHENFSVRMNLNVKNGNADSCELQESSFEERIQYFTRLSKFFTASDIENIITMTNNKDYNFVFTSTKELCVGVSTNVIMQNVIRQLSKSELALIVDKLGYDIGPISATKYGAYVIQVLMSILNDFESCKKVKMYFKPNIVNLLKHPIGNYSAQKIMNFDIRYIKKIYQDNFVELVSSDLGFKVFKKSYEEFGVLNQGFKDLFDQHENKLSHKRRVEVKLLIMND